MLVGGVVDDKIHDDANATLVRFAGENVEVGKGAIHWIDILVVGYIVAEVELRGWTARCDPDGVDAQLMQVVEPGCNPAQVAEAVVVAVGKAARIYLVDDGMLPPGLGFLLSANRGDG